MKKYEKVTRQDYEAWYRENAEYRERVSGSPSRLRYHLMPETGWLNDPNGLCQFQGVYHIYYQYTPFEPTGGIKLWGHYATEDFQTYTDCGPALFPDSRWDAHGVYSGSAFAEDGEIHYFYTGNVKYFDRDDYDYILTGRGSNTMHCTSRDGLHFSEKECLMTNRDYPADLSAHVRDPKIVKREDGYYMILGARDRESRGLALVYRSEDLRKWEYHSRIVSDRPFGYMWECPDVFELDGQLCMICCPQGVERRGLDYQNVHQCTFSVLNWDFSREPGVLDSGTGFSMVDRGFDFYAPQTFEDGKGRRILIGWMGIPDAEYTNPTAADGWQHALTLPRSLSVRNGRLIERPLEEICGLRRNLREYGLPEVEKDGAGLVYSADLVFDWCKRMELELRKGVRMAWDGGALTLDLGSRGSGRTVRGVALDRLERLEIFSDTTSLEIFVNGGEEVFTTRVYGMESGLRLSGDCAGRACVWDMDGFGYRKG